MKKVWLSFLLIGVASSLSSRIEAWPRLGQGAQAVTQNSGNKTKGISVTVSSTSVTQVYSGVEYHREVFLQNTDSTYYIFCGTHSLVSATSGPRWMLPPKPTAFTTNATSSIYCISEAGSSSIEILGSQEYDYKDQIPNP